MQHLELKFDHSPWYILLCLLAGALFAFILYQKKGPWSKQLNYLLATFRFILVSILAFLLIGPFLKLIKNTIEKPTFVFAVDNSQSIAAVNDTSSLVNLMQNLRDVSDALAEKDYNIEIRLLDDVEPVFDSVDFTSQSTNLSRLLADIQNNYEGRKLGGVILVSDGIYNRGVSPAYKLFNFPIYAVGLGDTVPKADLNLQATYYNKIAYQGNKFPLLAELGYQGFTGNNVNVKVSHKGKTVASKRVNLNDESGIVSVEFLLEAKEQGNQHYIISVDELPAEFTNVNNVQHAYIEVVEGKEKILLLAAAPHPDIKAIKSALEKNKNYEVVEVIDNVNPEEINQVATNPKQFDLVILHQLPSKTGTFNSFLQQLDNSATFKWYLVGNQTNLQSLNRSTNLLSIQALNNQKDNVTPVLNVDFGRFKVDAMIQDVLNSYPPVTVPFGKISLSGEAEILLYQRVGNITTNKPLLAVSTKASGKSAIMIGEGLWRWRLQEYANTDSHEVFDDLILKLVQYLSTKEDRRKFRVYPGKNTFTENERVVFETELYNDVFELIYGNKISLKITNEQGETSSFTYVNNENNNQYSIGNLDQGVYQYTASTSIDNETLTSSGEFTIEPLQLEMINYTANHDLLRTIASNSEGSFYLPSQIDQLKDDLATKNVKGILYAQEDFLPIINLPWVFFLLLTLVSTEWFVRKYHSSY